MTTSASCQSIRLLAVDLDGTLLDSQQTIPSDARCAIRDFVDKGGLVCLATARPPRSTRRFAEELDLDDPSICYNGAMVVRPITGAVLLHRPLPPELARSIISALLAADPDVWISLESMDKWLTDRLADDFPTQTALSFRPDEIGPIEGFLERTITKILASSKSLSCSELLAALNSSSGGDCATVTIEDRLLQITAPGVDKGSALRFVATRHGVSRSRILAVGNDLNDLPLLEEAAYGAAVGNAHERLRQVAALVGPSNDAGGVTWIMKEFDLV